MNKKYIITGYEQDEDCPTTVCVVGIHRTLKAAQRALRKLKNKSLKEFVDEYTALETDMVVVLMSRSDTRYSYTMVITEED